MRKYARVIILIISLGSIITGCGNVVNATSLIQAPMLASVQENEINKELKEILTPGSEFLVPKNSQENKVFL
ncbi:hypothetical protein [Clostridium beijerinckii]|uniref:hypothetical protein n=1 Tax=Clostridium beijerinckii TaxID=1520 RepID=UPI001F4C253B|nr:hypothetical protein [Clostridium beijerinckii]NRW07506.1 aconitase A [Clostridium beijerinckii]